MIEIDCMGNFGIYFNGGKSFLHPSVILTDSESP